MKTCVCGAEFCAANIDPVLVRVRCNRYGLGNNLESQCLLCMLPGLSQLIIEFRWFQNIARMHVGVQTVTIGDVCRAECCM